MEISYTKGNKNDKDRILLLTADNEKITIFDLAFIINQIAVNEIAINGEVIVKNNKFLFKNAIMKAIEHAEKDVDWADETQKPLIKFWAREHMLRFEYIDKKLDRKIQKKLEDFKK